MLNALEPMIRASARKYVSNPSSVVIGKAKVELLNSLPRYDARRSKPQTFVSTQLQGLQRWEESRVNGVRIPVRVPGLAVKVQSAAAELEDILGRPPSTAELAKKTNLTIGNIEALRSFKRPTPGSSEFVSSEDDDESLTAEDQILKAPNDRAWLEMIYEDLPDKDRLVMEHTLGMFGAKKLSTSALAKRMKISPGAVSQRRAKLQQYIDRAMEVNPF